MNWIDRKFARERNLEQSTDVWNSATGAIHDAVESYTQNAEYGSARICPQSGHRLLVEIDQNEQEMFPADSKRHVVVAFDGAVITVNVDAAPTMTFRIEADDNHCFLTLGGKEISYDEFSRHALEDALFKTKTASPARRQQKPFRRWMASQ